MSEIKVIVKDPEKAPEVRTIGSELESLQEIVGGYIQVVTVMYGVVMIVNEEGLLDNLAHNFVSPSGQVVGSAVFAGTDGGEFASLTELQEKQVEKYLNVLTEWGEE